MPNSSRDVQDFGNLLTIAAKVKVTSPSAQVTQKDSLLRQILSTSHKY